jgi:hypothetical protein
MSPTLPGTVAASGNDRLEWLDRAFSNLLGGGPIRSLLRRDRRIADLAPHELEGLRAQIGRRFLRETDPRTGAVLFRIAGPAVGFDAGHTRDEMLARRARELLPVVHRALDELDPQMGRPGVSPDDVRRLLDHIRTDLDALRAELEGEAVPLLVGDWFAELLGERDGEGGLFGELRQLFAASEDSVEDERQLALLDLAADTLGCLREAFDGGGGDGLVAWVDWVERCAGRIADQAVVVRDLLAGFGIGPCELEAVPMIADGPALASALRVAELEPKRFQKLARLGGRAQQERVRQASQRLCALWSKANGRDLADRLGLSGEAMDAAAMALDRLARLVVAFDAELHGCQPSPSTPTAAKDGTPPSEQAPMSD